MSNGVCRATCYKHGLAEELTLDNNQDPESRTKGIMTITKNLYKDSKRKINGVGMSGQWYVYVKLYCLELDK